MNPYWKNPDLLSAIEEKHARQHIADYNRDKTTDCKLKYNGHLAGIESKSRHCCYIPVDYMGVKFKKEIVARKP